MTRLVTFGCSLTYGEYLENIETESWPAQLAKLLDVEYVNISRPGASNKEILYNILNFKFQPDDICVILWTHIYRWTIFKKEHDIPLTTKQVVDENFTPIGVWGDKLPKDKMFNEHFWNENDMKLHLFEKSNHAQLVLSKLNIPVYHTVADFECIIKQRRKKHIKWCNTNWLFINFAQIRGKYPTASDNLHPGPEAYKEFAEELYNEIKR